MLRGKTFCYACIMYLRFQVLILIVLSLQANSYYYGYAVVHFPESFIYFGGYGTAASSVISKFDSITREWSNLGNLVTRRHYHAAIFDGTYFLVTGGMNYDSRGDSYKTEKCSLTESTMTCQQQEPELFEYEFHEMFLVPGDFCKNA